MSYNLATTAPGPLRLTVSRGARLSLGDAYLRLHGVLLLGYVLAGKGFAYLGLGPLYVAEVVLLLGMVAALATGALLRLPRTTTTLLLLLFFVWCGGRTLLDLPRYGIDALRDAVIYAYGLFAVLLAALVVSRPLRLSWLVESYARFGRFFVWVVPVLWLISSFYGEELPRVPGTEVAILQLKWTDTLVHLAGIASFQLAGLAPTTFMSLAAFATGFVVLSTRSRGAMLAFVVSVGIVALARPLRRRLWVTAAIVVLSLPLLLSLDLGVTVKHRELSARQVVENALSIVRGDVSWRLEETKRWRLFWWKEIWDYTVHGPYFWFGKGFGVNLAYSDGFDLGLDSPLRSPHSCHLSVLARAGVPGLLLWAALQLSWLRDMLRRYRRSRRLGQQRWSQLFLFLMAFWLALLVNSSFDVALEGPMLGVWFWSVFGVGIAAARLHGHRPEVLDLPHAPNTRGAPGGVPAQGPA